MPLTFGEKIKEARKQKNLTQKQLANLIGAAHNSISDWENNKNKPDPDTIELICGILEITPNYLLTSSSDDLSPFEKLLIKRYRVLDESGKRHIDYELDREIERIQEIEKLKKQSEHIQNINNNVSEKNTSTRIIAYYQHLASAGSGEYLFDDIPTDIIKVVDSPESRKADFVIGVNGDSMEPDYSDGEKVFVQKMPDIKIGEVGVFVRGNDCYIKECGKDGLVSRNPSCLGVEPFFDGIKVVGKVLGKAVEIN